MQANLMDLWLSAHEHASYNLGESGVTNLTMGQMLAMTNGIEDMRKLDFDHNDTRGSYELRQEIAAVYPGINPKNILVTAGVSEAILIYFHTRFKPGTNIVVPVPTFHSLYDVPEVIGFDVRKVSLHAANQFRLPLDEIEQAVDENTRAIVLNTPHNPTGVVYCNEEIEAIIRIAEKYDIDIVADEHYRFLSYDESVDFFPSLVGRSRKVVGFGSPGKCFGCVGLRVGWLIADQQTIERCHHFKSLTTHAIFKGNDYFAVKILQHRNELTQQFRSWIKQNIAYFREFQQSHYSEIGWFEPEGGSVAFPFLKNEKLSARSFAEILLHKTDVLILPGDCFNMPQFFRIRLGVDPSQFKIAIDHIAGCLTEMTSGEI